MKNSFKVKKCWKNNKCKREIDLFMIWGSWELVIYDYVFMKTSSSVISKSLWIWYWNEIFLLKEEF